MLYIKKNQDNEFALTLLERAVQGGERYLFQFIYESNRSIDDIFINLLPDDQTLRATVFTVLDGDGLDDEVNLQPGQYTYIVYEMDSTSLDPEDAIRKIETGRMFVEGEMLNVDPRYK
jgi:hypothetical protein